MYTHVSKCKIHKIEEKEKKKGKEKVKITETRTSRGPEVEDWALIEGNI
jgi:hypothetical protein